jgi:hypothetical protein
MRKRNEFEPQDYKLTCKNFGYTGVECCPTCHDPEFAEFDLRVLKVDGVPALLCCAMAAFFYPADPSKGITPEEKLLRAIFGDSTIHPAAEKYIRLDEEDD